MDKLEEPWNGLWQCGYKSPWCPHEQCFTVIYFVSYYDSKAIDIVAIILSFKLLFFKLKKQNNTPTHLNKG